MADKLLETITGAVVLALAIGFCIYAYIAGGQRTPEGYRLIAKFDRVDGLKRGSEVRIGGVKVGAVTDQALDPQTFLAVVTFHIAGEVKLPKDSSAQITASGLLGDMYLSIQPGADEEILAAGDELTHTQGAVDLVSLIGRMIFSQTNQNTDASRDKSMK